MRILYLTQWFDPEPAFKGAQFARALADRGHEVEVATGFPNYPGGKLYPGFRICPYRRETMAGLTIHRLALYPSHDRSVLGRIANYLSFGMSTLAFGLSHGGQYDAVYVYHPPLTPALSAALFCRWHKKPFVVEVQDLWPDSVAASGMGSSRIVGILDRLCRFVYARADHIIAQSSGMCERLRSRDVPTEKLSTIFNWATYSDVAQIPLPAALREAFRDRVNLVYGGNLGQAQNLESVVRAAIRAQRVVPAIRLHLIGDGVEREQLAALVVREGAESVVRLSLPVPRDAMDRIFDAADILVMHLNDDPLYNITIPSKTQHYLACGKPIVAGIGGDAAAILRESGAALISPPEDVDMMAASMVAIARMSPEERALMGQSGLSHYQQKFAFDKAIDKTMDVIEQVAYRRHTAQQEQ